MALINTITSPNPLKRLSSPPVISSPASSRSMAVVCHQNKDGAVMPNLSVDRRGMLLGLGGLYGMASQVSAQPAVAAQAPAKPMELPNCHIAKADGVVDYEFPKPSSVPLRVRPAAHLVDGEYVAKYHEALRRMKALPKDHPLNFYNMADNHYIPAHDNWLFLPWHRFYIYFYERVLGKLIDDPTFAIPFWNFDNEEGMSVPALFLDPQSSLYHPMRDTNHFPPQVLDFWYVYGAKNPEGAEGIARRKEENIKEIRKTYRQSLQRATLFMGDPHPREGEELGSAGRLDSVHKAIHQWVGPPELPWMDMGNIHKSTRDPIFYALHGNLDRMWQLFRTFRGNAPDFDEDRWLNYTFAFVDENGRNVRCKVKDSLDPLKMSYTYQDVPIPWAGPKSTSMPKPQPMPAPSSLVPVGEFGPAPRSLDGPVRVLVKRPKADRTNLEKALEVEVLHLTGIDVVPSSPARFDIFVSAPHGSKADMAGPDYGEFVGSYVKPLRVHSHEEAQKLAALPASTRKKGCLKLGITSILEDLEAEDAENLVVTLLPTDGVISVETVDVMYMPSDRPLLL